MFTKWFGDTSFFKGYIDFNSAETHVYKLYDAAIVHDIPDNPDTFNIQKRYYKVFLLNYKRTTSSHPSYWAMIHQGANVLTDNLGVLYHPYKIISNRDVRLIEHYSYFIQIGFFRSVIKVKKFYHKQNIILHDQKELNDKKNNEKLKALKIFKQSGYQYRWLIHGEHTLIKDCKRIFGRAKIFVIEDYGNAASQRVALAMAYGVLVVCMGDNPLVPHLYPGNHVRIGASWQHLHHFLVGYFLNPSQYDDILENARTYFELTQNLDTNAKHIIETICRQIR